MIISLFAEGITSLALPCTWAMAVPAALAAVAGGGRRSVAASTAVGLVGGSMLRAGGGGMGAGRWVVFAGIIVAAAFVVEIGSQRFAPGAGLIIGAMGATFWEPCVGEHLASVLNMGQERPLAGAVAIVPYAVGVAWVIPVIVVALQLVGDRLRRRLARMSATIGLAVGLGVASGFHTPLVSILARWSLDISA